MIFQPPSRVRAPCGQFAVDAKATTSQSKHANTPTASRSRKFQERLDRVYGRWLCMTSSSASPMGVSNDMPKTDKRSMRSM